MHEWLWRLVATASASASLNKEAVAAKVLNAVPMAHPELCFEWDLSQRLQL